jgi:hypothetical protein
MSGQVIPLGIISWTTSSPDSGTVVLMDVLCMYSNIERGRNNGRSDNRISLCATAPYNCDTVLYGVEGLL